MGKKDKHATCYYWGAVAQEVEQVVHLTSPHVEVTLGNILNPNLLLMAVPSVCEYL